MVVAGRKESPGMGGRGEGGKDRQVGGRVSNELRGLGPLPLITLTYALTQRTSYSFPSRGS
ncbi:hypothetical protein E2C01_089049 [Portunus trituberculatus]|uniref:Uncharacterized protein n=1 Tax=Portunus trituberculatus TaxID=210409 RepID=A0A5B7JHQ2_PORTR|nr:hypothetical protein [Portunus trituberculatus]